MTDVNGNQDTVQLGTLQSFGQRYLIDTTNGALFFGVDMTQIQNMSFVFEGAGAQDLSLDWGDWDHTHVLIPEPTLVATDITGVPLTSTGDRPFLSGFAAVSWHCVTARLWQS